MDCNPFFILHAPPGGEIDLLAELRGAPPCPNNGGANEFGANISFAEVFFIHVTLDPGARSIRWCSLAFYSKAA